MSSNVSFTPNSNRYDYHVQSSFPNNSDVHIHIHNNPGQAPQTGKPKLILGDGYKVPKKPSIVAKCGKKALGLVKRVRLSHIMALTMCGMMCFARFGMATSGSSGTPSGRQSQQLWMYNQGAQRVRDSVRIAELEKQNKVLSDSIKLLKKLPK